MLLFLYPSKKSLVEAVGQKLKFRETSMFGAEFKENGELLGSNRPIITLIKGREFFAKVSMVNGLIAKVS